MVKLILVIIVLSLAASARAADAGQRNKPAIKVTTKQDEALIRARGARMAEISAGEKAGGAAGVSSVRRLLDDPDPLVRGEAAASLGRIKDPAAFAALSEAVKSTDTNTRCGAIQGLAGLKDKRAVPALISALGSSDRDTRWKAAEALGKLGDQRAADALAGAAAGDKDKNVRLAAVGALAELGGAKAAAALGALKSDPDPEIKAWAAAASGRAGPK